MLTTRSNTVLHAWNLLILSILTIYHERNKEKRKEGREKKEKKENSFAHNIHSQQFYFLLYIQQKPFHLYTKYKCIQNSAR